MSVSQMNMTLLIATGCLCHRWTWICSVWHCQIQSFHCSWVIIDYDITGFLAQVTRLVSLLEHDFLIFWSSWIRPRFLEVFMMPNLEFSVKCLAEHCWFFVFLLFIIILSVHRFTAANYPRDVYKLIVCKRIVWNFFIRRKSI